MDGLHPAALATLVSLFAPIGWFAYRHPRSYAKLYAPAVKVWLFLIFVAVVWDCSNHWLESAAAAEGLKLDETAAGLRFMNAARIEAAIVIFFVLTLLRLIPHLISLGEDGGDQIDRAKD